MRTQCYNCCEGTHDYLIIDGCDLCIPCAKLHFESELKKLKTKYTGLFK